MKLIVFAVSVLLAVALAASNALAAAPPAPGAAAKPAAAAAAPKKGGGVLVMEREIIKGTRQAPRVYYVLEPAKPGWKAPEPARSFLGEVERSAGSGAL